MSWNSFNKNPLLSDLIGEYNSTVPKHTVPKHTMSNKQLFSTAKALINEGKNVQTKNYGRYVVEYYNKHGSFTKDQVKGLYNIIESSSDYHHLLDDTQVEDSGMITEGDYVKDKNGQMYRVYGVKNNGMLSVGQYVSEGRYSGAFNIHEAKVEKVVTNKLFNRNVVNVSKVNLNEESLDEAKQDTWRVEIEGGGVATVTAFNRNQAIDRALAKLKIAKPLRRDYISGVKKNKVKVMKENVINEESKVKMFHKLEDARKFLRSHGIEKDQEYSHMNLVNGKWVVQISEDLTEKKNKDYDKDYANPDTDEKGTLDPVDPKQLKNKSVHDRADSDLDNDSNVDNSDKYLHKRRRAISKAIKNKKSDMNEEYNVGDSISYEKGGKNYKAKVVKVGKKNGQIRYELSNGGFVYDSDLDEEAYIMEKTDTKIKNHSQYHPNDYKYLSDKGYSDKEILDFWDRDKKLGKSPLTVNKDELRKKKNNPIFPKLS